MNKTYSIYNTYLPRIMSGTAVNNEEFLDYLSNKTCISKEELSYILDKTVASMLSFHLQGKSVKLEGLGIFRPNMNLDGIITISFLLGKRYRNRINAHGRFTGKIKNPGMIGKDLEDLVDQWNKEHPDDVFESKI